MKKINKLMPTMFALKLPGKVCPGGNWQGASLMGRARQAEGEEWLPGVASLLTPATRESWILESLDLQF